MYPKAKILEAKEFAPYRDILSVILKDGTLYSEEEARLLLNEFLESEVD